MQKDIMKDEVILWYREGVVTKGALVNMCCCHTSSDDALEMFRYIEIACESGAHYFVYDNPEGYVEFEQNFVSNRFTSYHEFFTTEELAIEERGALKLKYFVRHSDDVYRFTPLDVAKEKLKEFELLPTKYTALGQYEKEAKREKA